MNNFLPTQSQFSAKSWLVSPTRNAEIAENEPEFGIASSKNRFMHQSR